MVLFAKLHISLNQDLVKLGYVAAEAMLPGIKKAMKVKGINIPGQHAA